MKREEDELQKMCVKWFDKQFPKIHRLLHHSPNGGKRTPFEGRLFKQMGTRAGFPDLELCIPNAKYHALFIEMKSSNGVQSKPQKEYQRLLEEYNYRYEIVRDFNGFVDCIRRYFKSID